MTTVTLYTRRDCHLCDQARAGVLALRDEGRAIGLREIDVDGDPALRERYGERVPVVEVAGHIVSDLGLDADALRARLDTVPA